MTRLWSGSFRLRCCRLGRHCDANQSRAYRDTDRHTQTHTDTDARVVCFADCFAASVPQLSRVLLFERVRLLKIPTSHENIACNLPMLLHHHHHHCHAQTHRHRHVTC